MGIKEFSGYKYWHNDRRRPTATSPPPNSTVGQSWAAWLVNAFMPKWHIHTRENHMQCNSSTFNIHINKLRINQLELSLNHIYIEKAIGYYHTGESGLQNSLMILILNTIISKTRISLMNVSLYNFLKNNFVPISFITTHLIIYLFNYLHYILIFYISNYI